MQFYNLTVFDYKELGTKEVGNLNQVQLITFM